MRASETMQFESGRVLQGLYANEPALLRELEDTTGCKITTRDGWIRFEGETDGVGTSMALFRQLEDATKAGIEIRPRDFQSALASVTNGGPDLAEITKTKLQCSSKKPPVRARTPGQARYLSAVAAKDIVFGIGPAGTGKTFLAMAAAVAALKKSEVSRLILTRPAVEAGEALGFLPGDLREKISPYLRPLYDALDHLLEVDEAQRYLEKGIVEVAPLAYMRGRTLNRAFVILDEAQNTTTEQMFMFLTRLGEGSKCVVTGDPSQVDLPPNRRSGLAEAILALDGVPGIEFVRLEETDVVRHPLVQQIILAYGKHRASISREGSPRRNPAAPGA